MAWHSMPGERAGRVGSARYKGAAVNPPALLFSAVATRGSLVTRRAKREREREKKEARRTGVCHVVSANGAVVDDNVPGPLRDGVPLRGLEVGRGRSTEGEEA